MHREGLERAGGARDAGLVALHQVQHMHAAVARHIERRIGREPEGVEELPLGQAGAHDAAGFALGDGGILVQQILLAEGGVAIPLDVRKAVVNVDRPRLAV